MQLHVKVDVAGAFKKLNATKDGTRKAIARALNKTATTARVEAARNIRDAGYGLKVGKIKDALSIRRATGEELTAVLRSTGQPIPLINYGARQTAKGVSVNVKNGRKVIPHAFVATMRSGHTGVFIRTGKPHLKQSRNAKAGKRTDNLPIDELFGPSIPSAFANDVVQDAVADAIEERFPVVLRQELKYLGLIE